MGFWHDALVPFGKSPIIEGISQVPGNQADIRNRPGRGEVVIPTSRADKGFTLVEVLIGFALAAILLGIILNTMVRQTVAVTRNRARYQGLLKASQALEYKMEQDAATNTTPITPPLGTNPDEKNTGVNVSFAIHPVTADPRVEQVEVSAPYGPGQQCLISAYRLRARRLTSQASK